MRTSICIASLLALGTAVAQGQELETYRTRRYVLMTNLPKDEAKDLGKFLDAMHKGYSKVFRVQPVRDVPQPVVRVYMTQDEYRAWGRDVQNFSANTRGFYTPGVNTLCSYKGDDDYLKVILSHEGFHQFAQQFLVGGQDNLPDWFDEGMANWFASETVKSGRLVRNPARHAYRWEQVQALLAEGRMWAFEELFSRDPLRLSGEEFSLFYHHAYLLMDFLCASHMRRVQATCQLAREGRTAEQITQTVIPEADRVKLYEDFKAWVAAGPPRAE